MRWVVYPTDPGTKPVEVEADELTELRNGWVALTKDRVIVCAVPPDRTLAVVMEG
jgi:hypothetical protein